jgi:ABC-type amino acid transport system permease subunit
VEEEYAIAINKNNTELLQRVNVAVSQLKADGTIANITNKYINSGDDSVDTSTLAGQFRLNFINGDRWKWIVQGLGRTLLITLFAVLVGILIGIIIAAIRSSYDKNYEELEKKGGLTFGLMKVLNFLSNIYLTVIRGTPVVVQLLIMYFIIFASSKNGTLVAILTFGINSGAYVAEIFRSGIMAIDNGQFEAGRAVGFNYFQTMRYIILPQMIKVVLPTVLNEFISLLKETSIVGYVGIMDLTKAGDNIRGRTLSAFMPLIAVALIYLCLVIVLTQVMRALERRMRKNER